MLTCITCLGLAFWGVAIEPNSLTVSNIEFPLSEWRADAPEIRLVALSDLHITAGERGEERLQKIMSAVSELQPDIVVLLGDFVNGHSAEQSLSPSKIASELSKLTRHGPVYYVLGNHDYYHGGRKIHKAFKAHGLIPLEGQSATIRLRNKELLQISGLRDAASYPVKPYHVPPRLRLAVPQIVLTHSPAAYRVIPNRANLILAGHTHGGQVCLPGGLPLTPSGSHGCSRRMMQGGFYREKGRATMYVSRGLGTSLLPIRLFCPPEIVCFRLKGKSSVSVARQSLSKIEEAANHHR